LWTQQLHLDSACEHEKLPVVSSERSAFSHQPLKKRGQGLGARGWGRTVGSKQKAVGNKTGEMVAEHGKVLLPSP
jgi:hypothetical protein